MQTRKTAAKSAKKAKTAKPAKSVQTAKPAAKPVKPARAAKEAAKPAKPARAAAKAAKPTKPAATAKAAKPATAAVSTRKPAVTIEAVKGGVTAAAGFRAAGIRAGIKSARKPDLAMVVSDTLANAAGTFTNNAIRAASVERCVSLLPSNRTQAFICNSGCANACTGPQGIKDNVAFAAMAASALGMAPGNVHTASTGVIGQFLPMDKIAKAMPLLVDSLSETAAAGSAFAQAIMTTDLVKKESAVRVSHGKNRFTIGGAAKGSGMIHPNMATMLCFITTDLAVKSDILHMVVKRVVKRTFNNLTVDGDTSTNDMVLVMANGASGVEIANRGSELIQLFEDGLFEVCNDLCKKIAADGEGATKRVEVRVKGARTDQDARFTAKAVATSNLIKCAMFGNDPNWGRIACAIGNSGARFSRPDMTIDLCGIRVFHNMMPLPFNKERLRALMNKKALTIEIDLGMGTFECIAQTCDFSYDYVKINAEYHT